MNATFTIESVHGVKQTFVLGNTANPRTSAARPAPGANDDMAKSSPLADSEQADRKPK